MPVALIELKARMQSLLKIKAYNDRMIEGHLSLGAGGAKRTRQLEQVNEKIKATPLETILRLSRAAEYRDEETGAHIQRMSRYAVAVARRMGIDESFIEKMIYGLPMHDIGKIGVPYYILLKAGKLSLAEWEIMKQHTTIGGKILEGSDSEVIQTAWVIALTHHEKWNGTGYPEGLKGADIPLVILGTVGRRLSIHTSAGRSVGRADPRRRNSYSYGGDTYYVTINDRLAYALCEESMREKRYERLNKRI